SGRGMTIGRATSIGSATSIARARSSGRATTCAGVRTAVASTSDAVDAGAATTSVVAIAHGVAEVVSESPAGTTLERVVRSQVRGVARLKRVGGATLAAPVGAT